MKKFLRRVKFLFSALGVFGAALVIILAIIGTVLGVYALFFYCIFRMFRLVFMGH
jgi:hypothetical protein